MDDVYVGRTLLLIIGIAIGYLSVRDMDIDKNRLFAKFCIGYMVVRGFLILAIDLIGLFPLVD